MTLLEKSYLNAGFVSEYNLKNSKEQYPAIYNSKYDFLGQS